MRIGWVRIPILLPLRCLEEVVEGICDILSLFHIKKAIAAVSVVDTALMLLRTHGPLDLVDVDVKSPESRVKIRILLR